MQIVNYKWPPIIIYKRIHYFFLLRSLYKNPKCLYYRYNATKQKGDIKFMWINKNTHNDYLTLIFINGAGSIKSVTSLSSQIKTKTYNSLLIRESYTAFIVDMCTQFIHDSKLLIISQCALSFLDNIYTFAWFTTRP